MTFSAILSKKNASKRLFRLFVIKLSACRQNVNQGFPQPISLQQMKENSKLYVPDRSRKNNTWSMNVSKQLITFRNQQSTI